MVSSINSRFLHTLDSPRPCSSYLDPAIHLPGSLKSRPHTHWLHHLASNGRRVRRTFRFDSICIASKRNSYLRLQRYILENDRTIGELCPLSAPPGTGASQAPADANCQHQAAVDKRAHPAAAAPVVGVGLWPQLWCRGEHPAEQRPQPGAGISRQIEAQYAAATREAAAATTPTSRANGQALGYQISAQRQKLRI